MRTIEWADDHIRIIDQTVLPHELVTLELRTVDELVDAIRRLAVRGAPALGVAGALGVALAARTAQAEGWDAERLRHEIGRIRSARPTAVNLAAGVDGVLPTLAGGPGAALRSALDLLAADVAACRALGERGADFLQAEVNGPLRLHTHCNAGALACVEWGTALGVVRSLHARRLVAGVLVDETRPLLQGARLTTWELREIGVEHQLVSDGAGPALIQRGLVDAVVVGADRIAANGDVANKVGTYALALAAARAGIPFVVAAPESTIDPATAHGDDIEIEMRPEDEVTSWSGVPIAPEGTRALNPAFDVTPAELVRAIVTERRLIQPSRGAVPGTGDGPPGPRTVTAAGGDAR
jgi:S-methyl-5-thioribose-1-phosphate isomerase